METTNDCLPLLIHPTSIQLFNSSTEFNSTMYCDPIPAATNSGREEEILIPQSYFVESPKSSNAERPCTSSVYGEDDLNCSNPRDSTSSSIFLLSSRPSSATFSSETFSLWRNGSSRRVTLPSPLCKTKLNTTRYRAVETNMIKLGHESGEEEQGIPRLWIIWFVVMLCAIAAALLIVWLVLRLHPPELNIQDFRFLRLNVFAGTDRTDVPTSMISVKSIFNLKVKNRSKHYKMQLLRHSAFTLYYNQVPIAQGQVSLGLKQESDSAIVASVSVSCLEAPLYGSGPLLEASLEDNGFTRFLLRGTIHTQLRIIGGIWNRHFTEEIKCGVLVHALTLHVIHMDCKPA